MPKLPVQSLVALAPFALLGACGGGTNTSTAVNQTIDATGNLASSAVGTVQNAMAPAAATPVTYDCLPAQRLSVSYDNSGSAPRARLTLDGKDFDLTSVPSADGAKYSTDQGRSPGRTLVWWNKGQDGTLFEGKVGGTPADEKKIASCSPSKG